MVCTFTSLLSTHLCLPSGESGFTASCLIIQTSGKLQSLQLLADANTLINYQNQLYKISLHCRSISRFFSSSEVRALQMMKERERDYGLLGQRINCIRACCKKKHTFRRDPRFIVFQGMRCALFWIPHKPEHLRINTSLSTKSSLVGLYSFQGNLQRGEERLS